MLSINQELAQIQTDTLKEKIRRGAVKPLFAKDFLAKSLDYMWRKERPQYPMDIKIAKDFKYLLRGDFEPRQVIRIEQPSNCAGLPVWFGNSAKGITLLGIGYQDSDSRKPCQITLGDGDIHALMAGATGQGKSVALESIITGIYYLYAPWSVKLTMLDAKIVSFKKFGLGDTLPHISSIGATSDVDFIISVLEKLHTEMLTLNSVFAKSGKGDKISDFIEETGLILPQNLIIIDEFTALLKFAGRKSTLLMKILDDFARLGRNTGYHLLLASQEFTSDVPEAMLNQIKVRLALGCTGKVSTKILGNAEAKLNIGKKGRLIANLDPESQDPSKNMNFRVPYNPAKDIPIQTTYFSNLGKKFNFSYSLDFYDEKSLETFKEFQSKLKKTVRSASVVYLGEPSFAMESVNGVKRVPLHYDGYDKDSTMVVSSSLTGILRCFKMLASNYDGERVSHNLFSSDKYIDDTVKQDPSFPRLDWDIYPVTDSTDKNFRTVFMSFYLRKLIIDIDTTTVVSKPRQNELEKYEAIYNVIYKKCPELDLTINQHRFIECCKRLLTKEFAFFGALSGTEKNKDSIISGTLANVFMLLKRIKCLDKPSAKEYFPLVCEWIIGMDRIIGFGRIPNTREQERFRDVILDSYKYNLRFYMFARDVTELQTIAVGCRYGLFEPTVSNKTISAFKCQDYFPAEVPEYALVLFDSLEPREFEKVKKMKKVVFDDEYY